MRFSPTLEEVKAIAATGQYNVLPVSCEILSDICTPIEAMKILKNISTHCYMLESVAEREKWGRYTFLGFDPKLEITCIDGEMRAGNLKFKPKTPPPFCGRSWPITRAPASTTSPPSPGGLWGIFPTITWATASPPCAPTPRTARASKTWT